MNKRSAFAVSLLFTTAFAAGPALAQTAPVTDVDVLDLEGTGTTGNSIIVTAQKFEQRAQDVPITITALGGERIKELGVTDLDELSNYVPGLNIQEQSANNPGVVIRGVTSDSGSAQQGPRVTLYYNGVDIARSRGSYQAIYDLERVEVIKGPHATLFGTASAVGAISLISARPRPGFSAELTGAYGNFDHTLLSGFVNGGNDVLAGRLAFEWKTRDGYVENLAESQEEELYSADNLGVRGSLRFTPNDDLLVDLIATFDRQRNGGTPFISGTLPTEAGPADPFGPADLGGSPFSGQALGNDQLGLEREIYDLNLTAEYELGEDWSFTTVNGYREFDSAEVFDADGSAAPFLEFAEIAEGWQFSHEGRFAYQGQSLRGSLGWNYFTEDGIQNVPFSTEEGVFIACLTRGALGVACVAPDGSVPATQLTPLFTGGALTQIPYTSTFENQGQNEAISVFADVTWLVGDRLELTAGLRYLEEDRESGYVSDVPTPVLPTLLPPAQRTQLLGAVPSLAVSLIPGQVNTGGEVFSASESYDAFLPRFNALFRLTSSVNLYATVAKGRRSPVVQLSATRVAGGAIPNLQLVPEEIVWNYESGVKLSTGMVSATAAVFYLDYSGFQVSVTQPDGTTRTESAGSASNLGVEAETTVQPAPWLTLFGNLAYINAKIDEDNALAPSFSGARFRLQPEWQAAAGFTVDRGIGNGMRVFATPSVTYRGQLFFELPNSELLSQDAVTLVNARAGISFAEDRFEVAAFIRNAFDENYLLDAGNTGGAFGIPTFIPAEPRLFGVQVTARTF